MAIGTARDVVDLSSLEMHLYCIYCFCNAYCRKLGWKRSGLAGATEDRGEWVSLKGLETLIHSMSVAHRPE